MKTDAAAGKPELDECAVIKTLVFREPDVVAEDIPAAFYKLYRTRNRACSTELVGCSAKCVVWWIRSCMFMQITRSDYANAPQWVKERAQSVVDCQTLDLRWKHAARFFARRLVSVNPVIQPAWLKISTIQSMQIPSNLVVSSVFALSNSRGGATRRKASRLGTALLDKYTPDPISSWHVIFFFNDTVRVIAPSSMFPALWADIISRIPDLHVKSKFTRRVPVCASRVDPGAKLSDTTTGQEIGVVVDQGSSARSGWALISEDYSQDQCILVHARSKRAFTAYIKS